MKKVSILFLLVAFVCNAIAQNVGINISNPTRAKLEVFGVAGGGATSGIFGSDGAGVSLQQNWPTIGFNQYRDDVTPGAQGKYMANGFAAIQYLDPVNGNMWINMFPEGLKGASTPAGNFGLLIKSNGQIGIRTTGVDATLTVGRGDGSDGTAAFRGTESFPSHFNFSVSENTYIRGGTAASNVYFNNIPSGDIVLGAGLCRLGINTGGDIPSATVEIRQPTVTQSLYLIDNFGYSWGQRVEYSSVANGSGGTYLWFFYGTNSKGRFRSWDGLYEATSDRKLKTNVQPLEPVLQKVNQLKPVSYEMKNNSENHDRFMGFVAQDVKQLFPMLVRELNNERTMKVAPNLHTISYSDFGVLAIKALQEQHTQITALENELTLLLGELEVLAGKK